MPLTRAKLLAAAEANQKLIEGNPDAVKQIIDSSALVFGVWRDPKETDGVGMAMIKGARRLRAVASSVESPPAGTARLRRRGATLKPNAILCQNAEHAYQLQLMFGESGVGKS
jgi:hypothetical protein